jgi:hypothetical protein
MKHPTDIRATSHVPHGRDASIAACQFRGLSHESLACLAANLLIALKRTNAELERQANDPEARCRDGQFIAELARDAIAAAEAS